MPRHPAGITKFQRLEILRQILKRCGKLNKQEIDQKVSASLGCSSEQLGRALYRDLQDLVDLGFVVPTYFTRDGQLISEYDPAIHKNTYCEWSIPESEFAIRGHNELSENRFGIRTSSRLIRSVWISGENPFLQQKPSIVFCFSAGGRPLSLHVESTAMPFKVLVGRGSENRTSCLLSHHEEEVFGKRAILLSVPHLGVSSFKGAKDSGHALLSFDDDKSVKVLDLNSKNGTHFRKVHGDEHKQTASMDFYARSRTVVEAPASLFTRAQVPEGQSQPPITLQLPVQLYFSFEFLATVFLVP